MKSGIYRTEFGNLIYVAKDRSIKATTLESSPWLGTKVSHRSKDDTVVIEGTYYRCSRVADVPNGCTNPEKALQNFQDAQSDLVESLNDFRFCQKERLSVDKFLNSERMLRNVATPAVEAHRPAEAIIPAGAVEAFGGPRLIQRGEVSIRVCEMSEQDKIDVAIFKLKQQGYRVCHSQSARKHRRAGDEVRYVPEAHMYAWRERDTDFALNA